MTTAGDASAASGAVTESSRQARQWLQPLPLLLAFLGIQAIAWTVVPPRVFTALHPNPMELAMWARDWYLVNYKHPALPSWLLGGAYFLFGNKLWVPYFMSQACIALTYLAVFLLGRDIVGARRALFAALLLAVLRSFTESALHYNHNMVQLACWAGFCLCLWRASQNERLLWWALTALVAALGVYSKFSVLMVIAFGAAWILADPATRARLRGRAPYLGLALFIVLLAPLVVALARENFGAVSWIAAESDDSGLSTGRFLVRFGAFILRIALAGVVGIAITLAWRYCVRGAAAAGPAPAVDRRALYFIALLGGGPLLLAALMSFFIDMRLEWASPMYSLVGLLLVAGGGAFWPRLPRLTEAGLPHVVLALAASLLVLGVNINDARRDFAEAARPSKPEWPAAEMAQRFDRLWAEKVGTPLLIVGGDTWTAGTVGLLSATRPSLFSYLDAVHAPAMTPDRIARAGVLVLWAPNATWQPTPDLVARYGQGREMFRWSSGPNAEPFEVDYLIIPPAH